MGKISISAVFAVGDDFKSGIFLKADHIADGKIFDFAKFFFVQIAGFKLDTGLNQLRRPQQTADVFGTKRRIGRRAGSTMPSTVASPLSR